jgi:hypothetical protein
MLRPKFVWGMSVGGEVLTAQFGAVDLEFVRRLSTRRSIKYDLGGRAAVGVHRHGVRGHFVAV